MRVVRETATGAELPADQLRRAAPRLLAIAAVIIGDAREAEDAGQDAMLAAWRRWDQLPELRSYLNERSRITMRESRTDHIVDRVVRGDAKPRRWKPLIAAVIAAAVVVLVGAPSAVILLSRNRSQPPHLVPAGSPSVSPAASPTPLPGVTMTMVATPSPWRTGAATGSGPGLPLLLYGGEPSPSNCQSFLGDTYVWDGSAC